MKASQLLIAGFAMILGAQVAHADGFVCVDSSGKYGIKLYDNVQPNLGTRNPAVMIISDGDQATGSKTLATFNGAQGNLALIQGSYHAQASFPTAYSQTFGGVRMSQIQELVFSVKHNFNIPMVAGETAVAQLRINDKNHNIAYMNFSCSRYLKR